MVGPGVILVRAMAVIGLAMVRDNAVARGAVAREGQGVLWPVVWLWLGSV